MSVEERNKSRNPGLGLGRIPEWGRRAATYYIYLRRGRGSVGKLRKRSGKMDDDSCGVCGVREGRPVGI